MHSFFLNAICEYECFRDLYKNVGRTLAACSESKSHNSGALVTQGRYMHRMIRRSLIAIILFCSRLDREIMTTQVTLCGFRLAGCLHWQPGFR